MQEEDGLPGRGGVSQRVGPVYAKSSAVAAPFIPGRLARSTMPTEERFAAPAPVDSAVSSSSQEPVASRGVHLALEHLVAAMVFLVLGSAGLVWVHADLAAGFFAASRVAAVTHLFTLGWITTSILGALYQFLPVALGVPIRSERLAHAGFVAYVSGLPLFLFGLVRGAHLPMLVGAAVFGSALLAFVVNLVRTLRRAPERNLTWWCLAGASLFLTATIVLGVSLAGNLRWGYLGEHRLLALGVHLHVALAGWVLMVAIGVAHRLLPMFLLSHDAPAWPLKLAATLTATGAGTLLLFHHFLIRPVLWAVVAMLAAGVICFAYGAFSHIRRRRKPALDPGMRLAAVGVAFLLGAVVMGPFVISRSVGDPRLAVAYGIALVVGGFAQFVAGHHYRIVPFLVWFDRYRHLVGSRPVPLVADLFSARTASAAGVLMGAGATGLLAGVLTASALLAGLGALLYASGTVALALQLTSLIMRRPDVL